MPLSASIQNPEGVRKIDFGSFSTSINSFVDVSVFRRIVELTIRNTNLMTFIDGFYGQSLNLTNAIGSPILFISGSSIDSDINQKIIGIGSLRKIGTGKLSLKGVNAYTGNTEVSEGTLEIAAGSLGNGNYSGNVINSAQFSITTPTQQTFSGIISGSGLILVSGDVFFTRNNTYTGQTSILAGGKLTISHQSNGNLTTSLISNAGLLIFSGNFDIRVAAAINGIGEIRKTGAARSTLAGSNGYSGKTEILQGSLFFEKLLSLYGGQSANWTKEKIIVSSGASAGFNVGGTGEFSTSDIASLITSLFDSISNNGFRSGSSIAFDTSNSSGGNFTISQLIPDSSGTGAGQIGVQKFGTNTLTLAGANTFSGEVVINQGTIAVSTFNSENQAGPFGQSSLPIKVGRLAKARILYSGPSSSTTKKIEIQSNGADINVSNSNTNLAISGEISGSAIFEKTGPGILQLQGSSTMSGNISVLEGALYAASAGALGDSNSSVIVATTAILGITGNIILNKKIQINGTSSDLLGPLRNISGSNEITGEITIGTAETRIGCLADLLKISSPLVIPTALVFRGTLSGSIEVSSLISGPGTLRAIMSTGDLILTNLNTFSGRFIHGGGRLIINTFRNYGQACSIGAATTQPIQIGNSSITGTIVYTGVGDTTNRNIQIGNNSAPPVAADTGGATIQTDGAGELIFSAAEFNIATNANSGVGANRVLTLSGNGNGSITGIIRNNLVTAPGTGTATISLVKSGSGRWRLSGANTFTGTTTINSGYLVIASSAALGAVTSGTTIAAGGSLQLEGGIAFAAEPFTISGNGPTSSDSAIQNNSGNNSISGIITLNANSTIGSSAGNLAISGAINGATRTLTVRGGSTTTISGIITLTTGGIAKLDAGTLILTAANSYSGPTTIGGGAIRLSNASALGTSSPVVSGFGQLELSGSITFARPTTIAGEGEFSEGSFINRSGNNTMSAAITLNNDSMIGCVAGIFTISGSISGATRTPTFNVASGAEIVSSGAITISSGGIFKIGVGILSLTGTNTLTGEIGVFEGTLRLRAAASLGTTSRVVVYAGATFAIQATTALTVSRPLTIIGDGVSSQGALQNIALSNTIGANILKVGGSTSNRISSASALTLTINGITRDEVELNGAAAPLTFAGAGAITLGAAISTTGTSPGSTLTKIEAGTLNLGNHAHVYDGATTISAGTLTRAVTNGSITATGTFTSTTLSVAFTAIPAIGSTWKFFPSDTTNNYSTVTLTGATGRTGAYNRLTSTLTIS
jgi:fibronectin-binding autotransporter adhesin